MISSIPSCSILGVEATFIEIEIDIQSGLPAFNIVGLPDNAVKEARERVRSAIIHSGYEFPKRKITVNLAPAHLKKVGSFFDLPIAVGILEASEQITRFSENRNHLFIGELSLGGEIRHVYGALLIANLCKSQHISNLFLPSSNKNEAALVKDLNIYPVNRLDEINPILSKPQTISYQIDISQLFQPVYSNHYDFSDVKGQYNIKRGVEIACAGNHNLLLSGPPGCGKTMIAKRIPTILPPLSLEEAIETTKIYSTAGLLPKNEAIIQERPFRAPHHTASDIAIIGGGSYPKPGEVSLSHNGILFLDELTEFKKGVLQVLREPMEEERVTISRVEYTVTFPSRFMLIAAMNPCPCGYLNHPNIQCMCNDRQKKNYLSKISGPLLDRIDIQMEVSKVAFDELSGTLQEESSSKKRERVFEARDRQLHRFKNDGIFTNSQMTKKHLNNYSKLNTACQQHLKIAIENLQLSARAYDKILKISRTIADLNNHEDILENDLLEAIHYRRVDSYMKNY